LDDFLRVVWEYQTLAALASWNWGNSVFFAKPFFDPRSFALFRVYIFCVRIWRSTVWSSWGVVRLFVVVDAAFLVTDGGSVYSPNYS